MTWNDETSETVIDHDVPIELVGTHLRLTGLIALGRFGRLTDLINASSGYIRVHDARLLLRNGDPTNLVLPELMVDQDEISFIAEGDERLPEPHETTEYVEPGFASAAVTRKPREFVMFTPGHTVTGNVHVFTGMDLVGFVDATDPRFVPVTNVTARSLADHKIISHYKFVLINRTQMIAASEIGRRGDIAAEDVPEL